MKIAIMQPYFFPYIGYWQLINEVDAFVVFDDVNYIKAGWINRNRIIRDDCIDYFRVPLLGVSQNKLINQVMVNNDEKEIRRNLSILHNAYRKAPYYENVITLIEDCLSNNQPNVALYNCEIIKKVCDYLQINTSIFLSSEIHKDVSLKGEKKILSICKNLGAKTYINPIGGMDLYHREAFDSIGITLRFLETNMSQCEYKQWKEKFVPALSIIDVLMFNDIGSISEMLKQYRLLEPEN